MKRATSAATGYSSEGSAAGGAANDAAAGLPAPDQIVYAGDFAIVYAFVPLKGGLIVLKPGEVKLPASYQRAFDQAVKVRDVIHRTAKPGKTAQAMMEGAVYDNASGKCAQLKR